MTSLSRAYTLTLSDRREENGQCIRVEKDELDLLCQVSTSGWERNGFIGLQRCKNLSLVFLTRLGTSTEDWESKKS